MNPKAAAKILSVGHYPADWLLDDIEVSNVYAQYEAAMGTTNGDTGAVTITARQAILFLRAEAILSLLK